MGIWKSVSREGARTALAEGLAVRQKANGMEVFVTDEAREDLVLEPGEEILEHTVESLLSTPVRELAAALASVDDRMLIVRAAARDDRASARPHYQAALGAEDDLEIQEEDE